MTLYRRQGSRPSARKRNAKKQNGCLRRPYKELWKEEKQRNKEKEERRKGKIYSFEWRFQRIARRDKKAFLSDQCKEIEGNNRMGQTRDLFKKIRDIKATFMKRWAQERTEMVWTEHKKKILRRGIKMYRKLWKKRSSWLDNHDGVITHLEPDILECEIKWALGSITTSKASGCDRIPLELFQIIKNDAVKVLHSICQQIWKTQQWPQDWKKVSFHSNPQERQYQRMLKLLHNCTDFTH